MTGHSDAHFGFGWKERIIIGVNQREGKKVLTKGRNNNNPCNQQSGVHRKKSK